MQLNGQRRFACILMGAFLQKNVLAFTRSHVNFGAHILRASSTDVPASIVKTISVQNFGKILQGDSRSLYQIVDVREPDELLSISLKGNDVINLPLSKSEEWAAGMRSLRFATFLVQQAGFKEVYNVQGGILKYADEVDPSVAH
eukprot:gene14115-30044_t